MKKNIYMILLVYTYVLIHIYSFIYIIYSIYALIHTRIYIWVLSKIDNNKIDNNTKHRKRSIEHVYSTQELEIRIHEEETNENLPELMKDIYILNEEAWINRSVLNKEKSLAMHIFMKMLNAETVSVKETICVRHFLLCLGGGASLCVCVNVHTWSCAVFYVSLHFCE